MIVTLRPEDCISLRKSSCAFANISLSVSQPLYCGRSFTHCSNTAQRTCALMTASDERPICFGCACLSSTVRLISLPL